MSRFQKARRHKLKLRLALCGPTGSGKTYTALVVAGVLGGRVAVIDTEGHSARKYVGRPGIPEFDVLELDVHSPRAYVDAIGDAEREGYQVIVVDSLSHAWVGRGGALEMVDNAAKRSKSGNTFAAWRDVTPEHNLLVDTLVRSKAHVIATMRSKMEYFIDEGPGGKKTPRKVGMAPVQREGLEYEFDVVGDMDQEHALVISKTRCDALDNAVLRMPGESFGRTLAAWLDEGEEAPARPAPVVRSAARPEPEHGPAAHAEARVDEYGIAVPPGKCPVVTAQESRNMGKAWSELPGPLVEKMYAEYGDKMNAHQVAWAEYLITRRSARKHAEQIEAERIRAQRELEEASARAEIEWSGDDAETQKGAAE